MAHLFLGLVYTLARKQKYPHLCGRLPGLWNLIEMIYLNVLSM